MSKEFHLTINYDTLFGVLSSLSKTDQAFLKECNKSNRLADKLLGLELLVRKRESQLEKQNLVHLSN